MSLDVHLELPIPEAEREAPRHCESCTCKGDETREVYWANITHNLNRMAEAAGIYRAVWRPEENGIQAAQQLIAPLRAGITLLESDPERFKQYDASNGWGLYEHFVPWLKRYLRACEENPTATIRVSR